MDCLQSYVLGSAHVHYHNVIIIEAFGKQLGVFSTPPPPRPQLGLSAVFLLLQFAWFPQNFRSPLSGLQHKIRKN